MFYFLYDLVDPRNVQPFYVGITNNPNQRMLQHLAGRDSNERKNTKISEIQSAGLQVKMRLLKTFEDANESRIAEIQQIQTYEQQGIQLTNIQHATMPWESQPRTSQAIAQTIEQEEVLPYWNYVSLEEKTADNIMPGDQIFNGTRWKPWQVYKTEQRGKNVCISYIDEYGRNVTYRFAPDHHLNVLS